MKFLPNTLLLVVLTIGFRNIYADDWIRDRERLGTHFLKFLETFHKQAVDNCKQKERDEVLAQQVAKHYGKVDSNSEEYGYVTKGETYTAFRNYTRTQIKFLWDKISVTPEVDLFEAFNVIRDAIEELAKDINGDTALSDKYKFERIPNLDYLETLCIKYLDVNEDEFLEMCPLSPIEEESVKDSHNTSVDAWVQERERLGTHFLKFLKTFHEIVLETSAIWDRSEKVYIEQAAEHYDSPDYGYEINGKDYTEFRNFTRTKIMILWNRTPFSHLTPAEASQTVQLSITNAIKALAKDINEDLKLPDKYKFEKLPNRDYFERILVEFFEEPENEFLEICPSSPPKK